MPQWVNTCALYWSTSGTDICVYIYIHMHAYIYIYIYACTLPIFMWPQVYLCFPLSLDLRGWWCSNWANWAWPGQRDWWRWGGGTPDAVEVNCMAYEIKSDHLFWGHNHWLNNVLSLNRWRASFELTRWVDGNADILSHPVGNNILCLGVT